MAIAIIVTLTVVVVSPVSDGGATGLASTEQQRLLAAIA